MWPVPASHWPSTGHHTAGRDCLIFQLFSIIFAKKGNDGQKLIFIVNTLCYFAFLAFLPRGTEGDARPLGPDRGLKTEYYTPVSCSYLAEIRCFMLQLKTIYTRWVLILFNTKIKWFKYGCSKSFN